MDLVLKSTQDQTNFKDPSLPSTCPENPGVNGEVVVVKKCDKKGFQ